MADDDTLEVRVRISARPNTVYRFLSDPERFTKWMGAGSEIDPTPGGAFSVRYPNGDTARGEVLELVPNRRVTLSYGYDGALHGLEPGSTRVVIELTPIDSGTLVTLRHTGLPSEALRRMHGQGWRHYLAALAAVAADDQFAGQVDAYVTDFIDVWNETDSVERLRRLERCWGDDAIFRDRMGYTEGREALNEYIGNTQQFVPGLRLERAGAIDRCHGYVRYPWRVVGPDGQPMATGANFVELAPDGRFASVVGFWDSATAR